MTDPVFIIIAAVVLIGLVSCIIWSAKYSRRYVSHMERHEWQLDRVEEINRRELESLDRWERIADRIEAALDQIESRQDRR